MLFKATMLFVLPDTGKQTVLFMIQNECDFTHIKKQSG